MKQWIASSLFISVMACAGVPLDERGRVNGPLQGHLLLGTEGWVIDLATGEQRRIPGLEPWDDREEYLGIARVFAVPRPFDGTDILETVHNCVSPEGTSADYNCLNTWSQGAFGTILPISGRILGAARLSPDGTQIALLRQYGASSDDLYLEILDREGNPVRFRR